MITFLSSSDHFFLSSHFRLHDDFCISSVLFTYFGGGAPLSLFCVSIHLLGVILLHAFQSVGRGGVWGQVDSILSLVFWFPTSRFLFLLPCLLIVGWISVYMRGSLMERKRIVMQWAGTSTRETESV
jgi:hypothetical protein